MNHRHLPAWLKPAPDSVVADNLKLGKWPWIDAVHLLWTVWVFLTPMFGGGFTLRWVLITLWSYPLFILLFVMTLVASRRSAPIFALAMVVLAMALLRSYPSGMNYFVFGCVMLRSNRCIGVRRYLLELALLNAGFVSLAWWIGYPWQVVAWIPALTVVIGLIVNVERASSEKDAALRLSHEEVRRLAATAERERIGRDLHDLLGHTLSLITLKLELSRKLFDRDHAAARREVEEAEKVARHALAEVRSAVSGIHATDLAAELASARLLLESSGVCMEYAAPPTDLPQDTERSLSLILREAATNIARHAAASCANVDFVREPASVRMSIRDNGRGGIDGAGNGLRGMRERVRSLGGTLEISSPLRGGTTMLVSAPLPVLRLVAMPATAAGGVAPAAQGGHSAA